MRDLLRAHADRGGTVLLSSHLLHEIEVIADDIVVIGQGRVAARGTKSRGALTAAGVTFIQDRTSSTLRVDADPKLVGVSSDPPIPEHPAEPASITPATPPHANKRSTMSAQTTIRRLMNDRG
jgi:ABC-type multidrug transport system ATPase subunit